jgi:hypothetical protein
MRFSQEDKRKQGLFELFVTQEAKKLFRSLKFPEDLPTLPNDLERYLDPAVVELCGQVNYLKPIILEQFFYFF